MIEVLKERYRCSEELPEFRLNAGLSLESDYFRFGDEAVCYGRALAGKHAPRSTSDLSDMYPKVSVKGSQIILPFDPAEGIDNLRLERYPASQLATYESVLKSIYYAFRPLTNLSTRKHIQRFYAAISNHRAFPQWPIDTSVESICENLMSLALRVGEADSIPFVWFWPNGARGCVVMTHDVETQAGLDLTPDLMDINDSFGIKASFSIVPEKRYSASKALLSQMKGRGFEVCVHDLYHDGRLFDDRNEFLRRIALINEYGREYEANGFRSAVLYRRPEWYSDLDFSFDMSIPNVAHLDPQRGGCCTVFPYFIGKVLELPLTTTQDYTLLHVLGERSIDLWTLQIQRILAKNGMAMFLVHPDYIMKSGTREIYAELLTMLAEMRQREALWFALPSEVDEWWRKRSELTVVKDGDQWRILGNGAERARLAFARLVGGHLAYELALDDECGARRMPERQWTGASQSRMSRSARLAGR